MPENNNPTTVVMKFGGTSVGNPEAMARTAEIIARQAKLSRNVVVVTSALAGVTDLLINSTAAAAAGDMLTYQQAAAQLKNKHDSILKELVSEHYHREEVTREINLLILDFANLCQAISVLGEASPRATDAVASLGERMAVRVLRAVLAEHGLKSQYIEATQLVITDAVFQAAHPDIEATGEAIHNLISPLLAEGVIPVVTGFIGATPGGITTTLGRGGSDYTASLLGALLPADEVWIWTDVNGVMSADPRNIPEAFTIDELTYREVSELAYAGAKVLHPKSIRPVIEAGIGLRVLNSFNPEHAGTRLVSESLGNSAQKIVKSVTAVRGMQLVTLEGRGMLGVPGVAARTFGCIAEQGASVSLISQASSEQAICFALPQASVPDVIHALQAEFRREFERKDIDRVWATDEIVIMTVVGEGMMRTPGVAGKIFSALGEKNINVIAIAQGSSEVSISFVLKAEEVKRATQALHELVIS